MKETGALLGGEFSGHECEGEGPGGKQGHPNLQARRQGGYAV